MPRPEQIVPRADSSDEFGEAAEDSRLIQASPIQVQRLDLTPDVDEFDDDDDDTLGSELEDDGRDLTGFDANLLALSDRPTEPITAGVPFGEGPSFIRRPQENDRDFLLRVADTLLSSPAADDQTKRFAERILTEG